MDATRAAANTANIAADDGLYLQETRISGLDCRTTSSLPHTANVRSPRRANGTANRGIIRESGRQRSSMRRWVRVFIKWFLLLSSLVIIGYGAWSWAVPSPAKPNPNCYLADVRIAELEDLSKKTTKMMQVQIELVDMKIGAEIEGLRKQLEERQQQQTAALYTDLRDLKAQTSEIESSLLKLRDFEHLTKQDVADVVNSALEAGGSELQDQAFGLDDVRAVARGLVEMEIEKHAADGLGRVDYALSMGGARVIQHSEAHWLGHGMSWQSYVSRAFLSLLQEDADYDVHPFAAKVLEPSFGEPGQCLPLKGERGFVDVALRELIFVEAVTLEHVAKSVAYDRSSSIKDFRIFGWLDSGKKDFNEKTQQIFLLGQFSYDLRKGNVQTFDVPTESTGKPVNAIRLDVLSNHGSYSHTCVYRLRVHGSPAKVSMPAEILDS